MLNGIRQLLLPFCVVIFIPLCRCDTLEPVEVYTRRRLKTTDEGVVAASSVSGENAPAFFSQAAQRPYTDELVRDNLCAFVSGRAADVDQVEVTVMSILQFVPGMRVAVATEADSVDAFERYVLFCGLLNLTFGAVLAFFCFGLAIDLECARLLSAAGVPAIPEV